MKFQTGFRFLPISSTFFRFVSEPEKLYKLNLMRSWPFLRVSGGTSITVTYRANQEFILQLRQTGVHGGVQNHVTLPAAEKVTTTTIPFTKFSGGLRPLNLADVAKFNFAFLANNARDGYAELYIYQRQ